MGHVRLLSVSTARRLLRGRAHQGQATVVRHLDLLADALKPKGYRCIKLYRADEFPFPLSLLWVFASGPDDHVGVTVSVQAAPDGTCGYYGPGYLSPCGDTGAAAERVDSILKHRMFPGSW